MGGIAGKDHAALDKAFRHALLEAIDAEPLEPILNIANHRTDAPLEIAVRFVDLDVDVGRQLPVDAPDIIGLRMDDDLVAAVEWRVEVEMAFLGKRQLGVYLWDEEQ